MVKKVKEVKEEPVAKEVAKEVYNLAALMTRKAVFKKFDLWLVGDTPLICHSWSEKARREMLAKQVKAPRAGKEPRDPQADFVNSLYEMGDGVYGFPVTGIKKCILSVAHKDKGIPRTTVRAALWLDAEMVRTRPALAGAVCDMPLVRVHGGSPEMREDMVRIGAGQKKVASLAYRGQFTVWACHITGRFNADMLNPEAVAFLTDEAGVATGLGEWRNEKDGMFGAFHRANMAEAEQWTAYVNGKGPLPLPYALKEAAE